MMSTRTMARRLTAASNIVSMTSWNLYSGICTIERQKATMFGGREIEWRHRETEGHFEHVAIDPIYKLKTLKDASLADTAVVWFRAHVCFFSFTWLMLVIV